MHGNNFLKENNARNLWHPMAHPAESQQNPPAIIVGAEGVHIQDVDGHRSLDAVGGLWNVNLGYSSDPVKQAISKQLEQLPYYSIFRGSTNDKVVELSYQLAEFLKPEGLCRAFYTSGGSDSIEVCLKLARQYHKVRGEAGRIKYISLQQGYHGTHFGGSSVNGSARFRAAAEPVLPGCYQIPGPYLYRNPYGVNTGEQLAQKCATALEDEIKYQGANTVAAFIMEPVQGAGGVIPPHPTFMPLAREICDRHGVLLIADEVITAFGRTGSPTGSRHWGVQPDMASIAKAITNGYFPFGAAMVNHKVADAIENAGEEGAIYTGYTYSGHPVGAAAALAALGEIERIKPWENAAARGAELRLGLQALRECYDVIGDVRGEGLMCAIEFVEDRESKKPINPALGLQFQKAAYEAGAMIRVSGPTAIFSPPLVISEQDVQTILSATEAGIAAL